MSLINELQEVAETADILTVLRKAKRLSGKLNRNDILEWIKHELGGNFIEKQLPKYRIAKGNLYYYTNGFVPAGWGWMKSGICPLTEIGLNNIEIEIKDSITNLQTAVTSGLAYSLPSEIDAIIRSDLYRDCQHMTFFILVSRLEIQRIIQSVRDVVLDWAIKLEQEGVIGEKQSFTLEEKKKAADINITLVDNAVVGMIDRHFGGTNV